MVALSVISMLPDLDVIAFSFGIPYENQFGHRGATHSIAVALLIGLVAYLLAGPLKLPPKKTGLFVAAVAVSHGLLDAFTNGGLGPALLWPFTDHRFWAPIRPIFVAPIGLDIFSMWGLLVILNEIVIFSPFWIYALKPFYLDRDEPNEAPKAPGTPGQ